MSAPELPEDTNTPPAEDQPPRETIKLDQFLKLAQLVGTGGEAKYLIQSGEVMVNGAEELRRGRKLRSGDVVTFQGEDYVIETD